MVLNLKEHHSEPGSELSVQTYELSNKVLNKVGVFFVFFLAMSFIGKVLAERCSDVTLYCMLHQHLYFLSECFADRRLIWRNCTENFPPHSWFRKDGLSSTVMNKLQDYRHLWNIDNSGNNILLERMQKSSICFSTWVKVHDGTWMNLSIMKLWISNKLASYSRLLS